ncbi:hypothetical protein [Streptomyces nigra]
MGRKMKDLEDDGSPLVLFTIKLRKLREDAGNPTLEQLKAKSGYEQPRLSELFNAKKIPTEDIVRDVVTALEGDADQWLERLERLRADEQKFRAAVDLSAESPAAQITRLQEENKRLRELLERPATVVAQAVTAQELANQRIQAALKLEHRARDLLSKAQEEYQLLHERIPEIETQAAAIVADGANTAFHLELQGRTRHSQIVDEAHRRAGAIMKTAEREARDMLQRAEDRAKEHRANSYASINKVLKNVDRLRAEAEQDRHQASARCASLEMRAKIEIERLVRQAQQQLERVGSLAQAQDLELLLLDFNISGSHTSTRGRHARRSSSGVPVLPAKAQSAADLIVQPPRPDWKGWALPQQGQ